MSSKSKKRSKRFTTSQLFQQAQRQYGKRQFKQALKDAKVCHRQQPTGEHRQFYELSLFARAEELCRNGLHQQCQAVVDELQELGVTVESVRKGLPEVLFRAGLSDKRQLAGTDQLTTDERARIRISMADQAVVNLKSVPASETEIHGSAHAIRDALAALELDDETEAAENLTGIARNSPFADWKFFVRGLSAYYHQDVDQMQANWDRLDPGRAAVRIASTLKSLATDNTSDADNDQFYDAIRGVDGALHGRQALSLVRELRRLIGNEDLEQAISVLRRGRTSFKRSDPDLIDRIKNVLIAQCISTGDGEALEQLTRSVDPPTIDPRWISSVGLVVGTRHRRKSRRPR